MVLPSFKYENSQIRDGCRLVAGVDEAGRGPLAGPVVAAAVILHKKIQGLNDSKLLSESKRETLYKSIKQKAISIGIGIVSPKMIDKINIHNASLRAMKLAVLNLEYYPDYLLVDGKYEIDLDFPQTAIISGDKKSCSIAAASIIAKVTRDRIMKRYHKKFPHYEFHRHKGYGTRLHINKIKKHGPSIIHRNSFEPIRSL